jgi:hypothetical protein
MEEQLRKRLADLRTEFENGRQRLQELEAQGRDVQQVLLRISGAIQVLEEELAKADAPPHSVVVPIDARNSA